MYKFVYASPDGRFPYKGAWYLEVIGIVTLIEYHAKFTQNRLDTAIVNIISKVMT